MRQVRQLSSNVNFEIESERPLHVNRPLRVPEGTRYPVFKITTRTLTWVLKVHQPKKKTKISFQGINSYCSHDSESAILKSGA